MGTPPRYGPRDFAAWFEVYLGGRWHLRCAQQHSTNLGGRPIGRGRDATRAAQHHIRTKCPEKIQGLDRRGAVVTSLKGRSSA